MRNILKISILIGILLGIVLFFFLPYKALSQKSEEVEMNVRVYHERPDIKTYAKEKVGEEWWAFNYIAMHESGWVNTAQNPTSSAFGIFQFLNSTWAAVGCIKTEDAYIQVDCAIEYMQTRYGSITNAQIFWKNHRWY